VLFHNFKYPFYNSIDQNRGRMKLNLFLASIFIGLSAFCQPDPELDSLKKYSYLIIGASYNPRYASDSPSLENMEIEGYATGFFLQKGKKLFLGSAYHVLTNYDVYNKRKTDLKIDFIILQYVDTTNRIRLRPIDIRFRTEKNDSIFFLDSADVHFIEFPYQIKDASIHTLNRLIYKKQKELPKNANQKIISFGYPSWARSRYRNDFEFVRNVTPRLYEGYIADSSHYALYFDPKRIDAMYLTTTPYIYKGTSGSPVFRIVRSGKKQWVEFAGIQSGNNFDYNCAYIVKRKEVEKKISFLK
jgi:hypothetical protein